MSRLFQLGEAADGQSVRVDIDVLVRTRAFLQASSGGGKSWTLRRIFEQTHGRVQQMIFDPEGEFSTLRKQFDYVLVGQGGDIPADWRHAGVLIKRLMELGASAIFDLFEMSPDARRQYVKIAYETAVNLPKSLWHPCLFALDEAHEFCGLTREQESADAVVAMSTRGRKRGYCALLASSRISQLSRDATSTLRNRFIGLAVEDIDRKRAALELGITDKEQVRALRDLDEGWFHCFGPAIQQARKEIVKIHVGGVVTPHAEIGRNAAPPAPAPEKVRALLAKLGDVPREAAEEAATMEDLRRRNRELIRELRDVTRAAPAQATKPKPVPAVAPALVKSLERAVIRLGNTVQAARVLAGRLGDLQQVEADAKKIAGEVTAALATAKGMGTQLDRHATSYATPSAPSAVVRTLARPETRQSRAVSNEQPDGERLTGPEQRILDAIAWLEAIGNPEPEQPAVAFLAGYTYDGGAFNNPRGRLRSRGLVEYLGNRIVLTETGRGRARAPEAALTTAELHHRVLTRLRGPEQRILRPLLAAYPESLSDADLAREARYTPGAGAFNNPKGRLRSLGLIEYPSPKTARAKPLLFLGEVDSL